MMYGTKTVKKETKKKIPVTIIMAIGKPRPMPTRGSRKATNIKTARGR